MRVLVTGYIGGRLVPRLLDAGIDVRCMSRDPTQLVQDPWWDDVEVAAADALEPKTLDKALEGCDAAFYLIHGMEHASSDFPQRDRQAARNFAASAEKAGLRRIVYLGASAPKATACRNIWPAGTRSAESLPTALRRSPNSELQ